MMKNLQIEPQLGMIDHVGLFFTFLCCTPKCHRAEHNVL